MFITKKHLTRRTVLRGVGTALALPLLDAMIPAHTALAQTAAKATPHLGFIYFPHGAVQAQWTPTGEGQIGDFKDILKPLDKYKSMTTVFSNIDNQAAVGPVHALSPGTWLSCVHPAMSQEAHGGTTADQIAAAQIGQDTPLPSLEVATETHGGGGFCDRDYGCSYSGTISFRTPTTPLPMENDPRKLFIRLFGQGDNAAERARLSKQYASLLDMVGEEAKELQRVLGPSDQAMLSDYLESVREIERRIQKMEARDLSHVDIPDAPKAEAIAFDQRINLMFDLVSLAFQANMTRIFTFMVAAEVSGQTYNHIGVSDAFHPLSHHNNEQAKMDRLVKVQAYHTGVFAKFLDKLAKMPDGDGTMLEHSLFLYGSNMSNSNAHNHYPLPVSIVGGWKGVKGGQHIVPAEHTPLANVLLTFLDKAGIPQDKIGDSTGKLLEV
ncbi:MAG: DUF1552 domain-containing protein [Bryobacterales bacterium]|nr:DUF1552 domain-containing protein [Bryobacterales bacterium]MBV9397498.1 DUF1552 domain-containing protein [Bryobacterales bacterium]